MNAYDHYDRLRLTSENQALEREHLLGPFSSRGSPEGQTLFAPSALFAPSEDSQKWGKGLL